MSIKYIFHHVQIVVPLPNYMLYVVFDDGVCKLYDVKPIFTHPTLKTVFKELRDTKGLFDKIKVAPFGHGVFWNDQIDLDCNELYDYGKTVDKIALKPTVKRISNNSKTIRKKTLTSA
jgi:hypothetical protein